MKVYFPKLEVLHFLQLFSFLTSLNVISRAVTNIHYNFDDPRIKKLADSVSYL